MVLFAYGFIYAFIGWCIEVLFYVYKTKRFVNRGFLHGPFVPIYGVCGVTLHVLLFGIFGTFSSFNFWIIMVSFILIVAISTLLELVGGFILFKIFETRWWDYSNEPLNYKGFIALRFSLIWGVLGLLTFFGLHVPLIIPLLDSIPKNVFQPLVSIVLVLVLVDYLFTLKALIDFKTLLSELRKRTTLFDNTLAKLKNNIPDTLKIKLLKLRKTMTETESFRYLKIQLEQLRNSISKLRDKSIMNEFDALRKTSSQITDSRFYKAFPFLKIPLFLRKEKKDEDNKI